MKLEGIAVGDEVIRLLGGEIPMPLKVDKVTDALVVCGPWEFDKITGAEIDEELGWGVNGTGSFIIKAGDQYPFEPHRDY